MTSYSSNYKKGRSSGQEHLFFPTSSLFEGEMGYNGVKWPGTCHGKLFYSKGDFGMVTIFNEAA